MAGDLLDPMSGVFTDLGSVFKSQFFSVHEHGTDAAGVGAWLLGYNADDTTAMAVIRDGMRNWTAARGAAPHRALPA